MKKVSTETTSPYVARIAGKILRSFKAGCFPKDMVCMISATGGSTTVCTVAELRSLAASALTQTPNKPAVADKNKAAKKTNKTK